MMSNIVLAFKHGHGVEYSEKRLVKNKIKCVNELSY